MSKENFKDYLIQTVSSNLSPEEMSYMAIADLFNDLAGTMDDYLKRVESAFNFAEGFEGETWNGMFMMGLTLANLELVPTLSMITPEVYWTTAPKPKAHGIDWIESWIVQREYFKTKAEKEKCKSLSQITSNDLKKHLKY